MDTLRAYILSSLISTRRCEKDRNLRRRRKVKKSKRRDKCETKRNTMPKLVKKFEKLSHDEKMLFLIKIRDITKKEDENTTTTEINCVPQGASTIVINPTTINNGNNDEAQPLELLPGSSAQVLPATFTLIPLAEHRPRPPVIWTNASPQHAEIAKWLQKNFVQDNDAAMHREEIYNLYMMEFASHYEKLINPAGFGKLIKQIFPGLMTRRLGKRGHSKYCYANLRKRSEIEPPRLPTSLPQCGLMYWAENVNQ